jgi:hypothetical protein
MNPIIKISSTSSGLVSTSQEDKEIEGFVSCVIDIEELKKMNATQIAVKNIISAHASSTLASINTLYFHAVIGGLASIGTSLYMNEPRMFSMAAEISGAMILSYYKWFESSRRARIDDGFRQILSGRLIGEEQVQAFEEVAALDENFDQLTVVALNNLKIITDDVDELIALYGACAPFKITTSNETIDQPIFSANYITPLKIELISEMIENSEEFWSCYDLHLLLILMNHLFHVVALPRAISRKIIQTLVENGCGVGRHLYLFEDCFKGKFGKLFWEKDYVRWLGNGSYTRTVPKLSDEILNAERDGIAFTKEQQVEMDDFKKAVELYDLFEEWKDKFKGTTQAERCDYILDHMLRKPYPKR